jgi:23S rRNA (adenine2030-N6)-methyltransferase
LVSGLGEAYRRWPTGIFVLWHPIKERPAVWRFHEALEASGIPRILAAEMTVHPEDTHLRLNGSGLIIVNPPWRLDTTLTAMLPCLHAALPTTGGGSRVTWLSPEHRAGTGNEPETERPETERPETERPETERPKTERGS